MAGTPVKVTCAAKIPRRIWVENLVVLWRWSWTSKYGKTDPTSFPGSFLYFEKVEKGPWERGWDWPWCARFQWNEFHSKYSSNSKQRWLRKWRPSKIKYDEVIKWSNFTSVIIICMLTLLINQDILLRLMVENPFEDITPKLSFELLSFSLKLELHLSAII